jgi:site-specific DNA-methyltransferase (adenine-specific)
LRVAKNKNNLTFNTYCRYGPQEKDENGKSLLNADLEDVFYINKEYAPGEFKNINKLPLELINKLILYSSNEGDIVADFFLGNFTTAYGAKGHNRDIVGFETNEEIFNYHIKKIRDYEWGILLKDKKEVVVDTPKRQGQRITEDEVRNIKKRYIELSKEMKYKKDIVVNLCNEFERGKFSIINILKR